MRTRVISAAVALALLVPCLVVWGTNAVEAIVGLVMAISLFEFVRMAAPDNRGALLPLLLVGGGVFASVLYQPEHAHAVTVAGVLLLFFWSLFATDTVEKGFDVAGKLLFGLVWVVILGVHLPLMTATWGMPAAVLLLLIVFAGDTGAYFSGRALGKKKLFERVSPKKTWAGVYGGLASSVAVTVWYAGREFPELGSGHAVVLAVLVGAAGVVGDLVESMVKRACNVKDSGSIMPGHGGALDRVDSVLMGAPVMYLYLSQTAGS
ncbi:MAG: phosphatidate cytidylyltransferase [Myxococcota bacterium]|nr:phosphatidate cytidylyltransferase [Myxococcota bacterium]